MTAPTFHRLCGENVRLNSDRHVATREKGFDRGLCALSNPLSELFPTAASASGAEETPPPSIRLVVTKTNAELSGGLGLGVSARAPSSGSSTVLPTNSSSAGKGWAFTQVPQSAVTVGTLVTVWFDRGARELCYSTAKNDAGGVYENGTEETSGELELDDPEILDCLDTRQPLWLYVDVYGFVKEVKLLEQEGFVEEAAHGGGGDGFVEERFVPESRRIGGPHSGAIYRPRETHGERRRKARWENQQQKKKAKEAKRKAEKETREQDQSKFTAIKIEGVVLRVTLGDITEETTEAVVNSTNVELDLGGRVSEALVKKGGKKIVDECIAQKKMVNNVFISTAGDLFKQGIKWIVHVRAPRDTIECENIIKAGLSAAGEKGAKTISVPMIGAGTQGKKPEEMTRAIVRACCEFARTQGAPRKIEKIKLIGFDSKGYSVFVDELTSIANTLPPECRFQELYKQIPIDQDSDEYESASKLFTDAKLTEMELVCIYKTKAPHLEKKFIAHKDQLKNQYTLHPEISDALEREVFHGTQQVITTKILTGGFNPKFGAQDPGRTVYGQGCYFARDLRTSAHDDYSVPNEDGLKFVFVVRLLAGATFKTTDYHKPSEGKLLTAPPFNDDTGYSYDTGVWPTPNPSVFVSFHTDQALPLYLLVLKSTKQQQPVQPPVAAVAPRARQPVPPRIPANQSPKVRVASDKDTKNKKSLFSRICPIS